MPDEVSISFEIEKIDKKRQKIDKEIYRSNLENRNIYNTS